MLTYVKSTFNFASLFWRLHKKSQPVQDRDSKVCGVSGGAKASCCSRNWLYPSKPFENEDGNNRQELVSVFEIDYVVLKLTALKDHIV